MTPTKLLLGQILVVFAIVIAGVWSATQWAAAKVRLVPNDNRDSDKAPAFRVFVGASRIGDAWEARSGGDTPKDYLRVRLDDPSLPEPISAALFPSEEGTEAQMVWSRRRE